MTRSEWDLVRVLPRWEDKMRAGLPPVSPAEADKVDFIWTEKLGALQNGYRGFALF